MRELKDQLDKLIKVSEDQVSATKENGCKISGLTKAITTRGTWLLIVVCVVALGKAGADIVKSFIIHDKPLVAEERK